MHLTRFRSAILSLGVALCCCWQAAPSAWAQNDRVFGPRGTPTGSITAMNKDELTIDVRGRSVTIPVNEITKIAFDEDTGELRTARDRALQGQYEDALRALRDINPETFGRAVVAQDVKYFVAFCQAKLALAGQGDATQAGSALYQFTRDNPGSYHFYEANELIGDLFAAMGRYDNAAQFYAIVGQAPWPDYKMRAAVLEADALRMKGDFPTALVRYEQVASASLSDPLAEQQKLMATIGKAVCLANTGKPDEAIKIAEEVIAKNDPREQRLFARAYNALGAAYLKSNRAPDALLAYLHTHLLFFQSSDAHAEALYHLATLWEAQREPQRALEARQLLKQRYGGTSWANRQ